MLDAIGVALLYITPWLMVIFIWAYVCVYRTNNDLTRLRYKKDGYFDTLRASNADRRVWTGRIDLQYEEAKDVSPEQHCWRRFTLRNPWRLYGPITISLVKDYPMDETFWEWHKYGYQGYITAHEQSYIIKRMAKENWSRSYNPMSFMFERHWNLDLNDFRPQPKGPVMLEGAAEYDEIMKMQEMLDAG